MGVQEFMLSIRSIPYEGGERIAIIADADVVGKEAKDSESGIILRVPRELERSEKVDDKKVLEILSDPTIVSILLYGERSISIAIKAGFVHRDSILDVGGLKHAIVYKFALG